MSTTEPTKPQVGVARDLQIEARSERGVAMSESHYRRIQDRIRRSAGSHSASIWLALALAFFGVATTVWITVFTVTLLPNAKGQMETTGWACIVLIAVCVAAHFTTFRERRSTADDICYEMDTYCQRTSREDT
jgi:uncharacterized membrane protein